MSDAVKLRIMTHMNKDHVDSLTQYLQFYHALVPTQIPSPQMIALSDSGMTLTPDSSNSSTKAYFIAFQPELVDLEGIRPRVIEMANRAKQGVDQGRTVHDDE